MHTVVLIWILGYALRCPPASSSRSQLGPRCATAFAMKFGEARIFVTKRKALFRPDTSEESNSQMRRTYGEQQWTAAEPTANRRNCKLTPECFSGKPLSNYRKLS